MSFGFSPVRLAVLLAFGELLVSCGPAPQLPGGKVSPSPAPTAQAAEAAPAPPVSSPPESTLTVKHGEIVSGVPDEARVREIAGFLASEPRGVGRPISDRAAWADFPHAKEVVSGAERELAEPFPELPDELFLIYSRTGSRKEYEAPCQRRTKLLADFAVAECIEDRGRFLPAIESALAAILGEQTWTMPGHDPKLEAFDGKRMIVDLGAAMRAWNLATVDYLVGDRLNPATRERIRAEVDRRVLESYKDRVLGRSSGSGNWWLRADHNWNAVCHAGVIGSALALVPSAEERAWFLAAMEIHIPNFLAGFTPDGYCSEGIGYWNYGFGHYVLMAEAVGQATGGKLDLYAPAILRNILTYPRRMELQAGVYPSFSDNDPAVKPSPWIFQIAGRRIPGSVSADGSPVVSGVASHSIAALLYQTMILAFADLPPAPPAPPHAALPLRDAFPDAGIVVCRPADGKGLAIAIKAGHNAEHHNHNDIGSYVVALGGRTPFVDPGMEIYTKRTFGPQRYDSKVLSSYGHPVPVVAGKLQDTGAGARGTISAVETTDAADHYVLDLTAAYAKSVPALKKLTRHLRYTRSPRTAIEISDEVVFDSPQTFGGALVTFSKIKAVAPDTLVIYESGDAVQVKIGTGGGAFTIQDEVLDEKLPSGRKALRVGLSLNEPVMEARICYMLTPAVSPASSHSVVEKPAGAVREPNFAGAVIVEAEAFSRETGGTIETVAKNAASGGAGIRLWNDDGHTLAWKFRVAEAGNYGVLLRYCNGGNEEVRRALQVDGAPADGVQGGFAFPPTGGWSSERDDWKEAWLAQSGRVYTLTLAAGEHTVSLRNLDGGGVTLDWIALVPLKK